MASQCAKVAMFAHPTVSMEEAEGLGVFATGRDMKMASFEAFVSKSLILTAGGGGRFRTFKQYQMQAARCGRYCALERTKESLTGPVPGCIAYPVAAASKTCDLQRFSHARCESANGLRGSAPAELAMVVLSANILRATNGSYRTSKLIGQRVQIWGRDAGILRPYSIALGSKLSAVVTSRKAAVHSVLSC